MGSGVSISGPFLKPVWDLKRFRDPSLALRHPPGAMVSQRKRPSCGVAGLLFLLVAAWGHEAFVGLVQKGLARAGRTARAAEDKSQRPPWDAFRALRTAAFFGALPNPLGIFERSGESQVLARNQVLWSAENPLGLVWGTLDDVVMGGASESALQGTTWTGTIITEGGGFAGIRTQPLKPAFDVSACTGLRVRVKGGGGQRFKLIIRDSYDWNGIAWSYEFETQSLIPSLDGVVEANAPFSEFVPTLFARTVPGQSFNTKQLTAVQLTLSKFGYDGALNPNFRAGSFSLEVESMSTF